MIAARSQISPRSYPPPSTQLLPNAPQPVQLKASTLSPASYQLMVEGISHQDEAAARRFVKTFLPSLKWQVSRSLSYAPIQEQEDVLWDTLAWLLQSGGQRLRDYDATKGASPKWWVLMKARGHITNMKRAYVRRRKTCVLSDDVEKFGAGDRQDSARYASPLEAVVGKRFETHLLAELHEKMSPTQRQTFFVLFVENQPYLEAATTLGCSYDALRRRTSTIRSLARSIISAYNHN